MRRGTAHDKRLSGQDPPLSDFVRRNRLLCSLPARTLELLTEAAELLTVAKDDILFEPGEEATDACFPLGSTVVALVLPLQDGRAIEAGTIGCEGAVGGIVSVGAIPAFARGVVRLPGDLVRIPIYRLEQIKRADPRLHDALSRYTDCLVSQLLQSVACATVHPLLARCARWLLAAHDRLEDPEVPLTQDALAEMFGVARSYMTRIANALQAKGAISYHRGLIRIEDRAVLEDITCECYGLVKQHCERLLPDICSPAAS